MGVLVLGAARKDLVADDKRRRGYLGFDRRTPYCRIVGFAPDYGAMVDKRQLEKLSSRRERGLRNLALQLQMPKFTT
jgi:hypothetical protein